MNGTRILKCQCFLGKQVVLEISANADMLGLAETLEPLH